MSPGREKLASVESAMLWARPIPDSSISAAPDRNLLRLATIVDLPCGGISAYTAELDVNDPAGAQFDGRTGMLVGVNALIKANWGIEFAL